MRKLNFVLGVVLLLSVSVFAQKKNAQVSFEVAGVCGMCKATIEKAALDTKGVKSANWDVDTHMLSLVINEKKTDVKTIQQNIADAGYSSEGVETSAEAYNGLNPCCKYNDPQVVEDHK